MNISEFLSRHETAWEQATNHPFINAVRDGTLPFPALTTWLAQDYLFVAFEFQFIAELIGRAPRSTQKILIAGLSALENELGWFEEQAQKYQIDLNVVPEPITLEYQNFFNKLAHKPFSGAFTALWALERAYLESWNNARPGTPAYQEFIEHWTVPEFADYVAELEQTANRMQSEFDEDIIAEALFLEVAQLEEGFWEMALKGGKV